VIYLACLILSGLIYWSCQVGNLAGFANAKRTVLAMYRAADAGLIRSARSSLLPLTAVAVSWAIARVFPTASSETPRPAIAAAYVLLAVIAGGLSTILLAYIALNWIRVSALRTISAALASADRLLVTVARSSAALALLIEGLGFAFSAGIAMLCWATSAAGPAPAAPQIHALLNAAQVLSDFAMGAILVGFAMQASGTTYRMCSRMGSAIATHDANLGDQDPRNPSTIADAAGIQLGQLIPDTLDAFCSSLCSNALLLFMLWTLRTDGASSLPASYLLLPLVLRAFGALATVFATASMRTMESLNPASALLRAQAVFVVIVIGAIGGGCTWLVPEQLLKLTLCGLVGLLVPLAMGHWQAFVVNRAVLRSKAPRTNSESFWAEGLSIGMLAVAGPLALLLAVLICILRLGPSTGAGHAEWLAPMVCYLGMGIAMPFCITIEAARPLVALSRRAVHLIDSLRVDDGQRRLARLEEASYSAASHAISAQTQTSVGMPLLAALAIGILAKGPHSVSVSPEIFSTLYVFPLSLLVPLAVLLQGSLRASRAISNEVRRQLSGFPQEAGVFRVPAEFTPSYRNCVDIASRESTRRLGLSSAAFVAIPLVYSAVLFRAVRETGPAGRALGLYLGVIAVAVSALGFILEAASDFANKTWSRTPRATNFQQSIAIGDVMQHLATHATPAVRLLAKATVIVALSYSPYVL
jgi:Na+/H+-translocating membrane pyrophosphatase